VENNPAVTGFRRPPARPQLARMIRAGSNVPS
jgi:hypothetical protein